MAVAQWLKDLNEEVFSKYRDKDTIPEPNIGDVVWYDKFTDWDGKVKGGYPVQITGGQFYGNYGFSNYWYWKRIYNGGVLGEQESGYGNFKEI